jgi:dolichyl-phosphate-mannose-protein mannosyltransferase
MKLNGKAAPGKRPHGASAFASAAYWLIAPLLCLVIYKPGLTAWFQADDFAWLGLRLQVHDARSLWHALFSPMAQGTIRPWSERAFFLILETIFGVNALPFRICVFLTQCVNLTLLAAITRRLTGSPAAGLCAAVLWLVNNALAWPMVWTCVYNQILCGFFLMSAFWFLLRYIETGQRRYYVWQWFLFLVGFGALEINVVYPALAALYTFLCARNFFRATLPLFLPSAIFTVADRIVAPAQHGGPYAFHVDGSIPATLLSYCYRSLVPIQVDRIKGGPDVALGCLFGIALIGFAILTIRRKDWLPLFCIGWFGLLLAPVLPLRDHFSTYYLVLPTIGFAMLGGYALASARRGWKAAGLILAAIYVLIMVTADRIEVNWWQHRSIAIQRMVLGVARAHQLHPTETILLDGVDTELFRAAVYHHPFFVVGAPQVYLTPGSAAQIGPQDVPVEDFELPGGLTVNGLNHSQIVVYRVGGPRLKAITSVYEKTVAEQLNTDPPPRLAMANPLTAYLLGPEWYAPEEGFRWMPRRATVRIGCPRTRSERLYLTGFGPPNELRVSADGVPLGQAVLKDENGPFQYSLSFPDQLVGRKQLEMSIEVGHTFRVNGDGRDLGLAFSLIEIR